MILDFEILAFMFVGPSLSVSFLVEPLKMDRDTNPRRLLDT